MEAKIYSPVGKFAERAKLCVVSQCYKASVCANGITSLSLSDSCNISCTLSHSKSPNHQPTDTLSRNLHNRNGPTFHDDTTGRRPCTQLCRPLHTRSIWPTSQSGG